MSHPIADRPGARDEAMPRNIPFTVTRIAATNTSTNAIPLGAWGIFALYVTSVEIEGAEAELFPREGRYVGAQAHITSGGRVPPVM